MGSWQAAADCEGLFKQHQGYLSLDKKYHVEIAWLAMVQDSFNAAPLKARTPVTQSICGVRATMGVTCDLLLDQAGTRCSLKGACAIFHKEAARKP